MTLQDVTLGGDSGITRVTSTGVLQFASSPLGYNGLGNGHTLENAGRINWVSGQIRVFAGAVLNNLSGAVFDARSDGSMGNTSCCQPIADFNNAGTFLKSGGGSPNNSTYFDGNIRFNNSGLVDVRVGQLWISYGEGSGDFNLVTGTKLTVAGRYLVTNGGSLSGEGTVAIGRFSSLGFSATTSVTGNLKIQGVNDADGWVSWI